MVDTVTLARVVRLGYTFDHDYDTDTWWYRKDTHLHGPYRSMDEAAYDALAEHEMNEAYNFWRTKDAEAK